MIPHQTTYLRSYQQELAEKSVEQQYQRQPELWQPYDERGRQISIRDTVYHLTYLAEAIEADDPLLFSKYLAWVKVLFANLNFPDHVLPTTLACIRQALTEELPAAGIGAALHGRIHRHLTETTPLHITNCPARIRSARCLPAQADEIEDAVVSAAG